MAKNPLHSSKSVEWYTPSWVVQLARDVMGGPIDLDPASCSAANRYVEASRFFTQEESGLMQVWKCDRLWLNPPYGKGENRVQRWVWKALNEFQVRNFHQGCLLVNAVPDRTWFQPLWQFPVCFFRDRIRFVGAGNSPTHGNALFGLGVDALRFEAVMSKHGHVCLPRTFAPPHSRDQVGR